MTAELGQTDSPTALIPGDPAAVTTTAQGLTAYGDELQSAGQGLQAIDTTAGWSGTAADAFRSAYHGQPTKWLTAGDAFHTAASALDAYASTLTWARQQAGEAIQLWNQAQAATAQAQADHAHAVQQAQQQAAASGTTAPAIPFTDPGAAQRAAAQQTLTRARNQLASAGNTATAAVGRARDQAPQKPGFWSRLGSAAEEVGSDLAHVGEGLVNSAASLGNAILNDPGATLLSMAGAGMTTLGAGGEAGGAVLDATGIGALLGVPAGAVSTAAIGIGSTMAAADAAQIGRDAAGSDKVSVFNSSSSGGGSGWQPTKTDRIAEHLTPKDLEGAQREMDGEVVARKSSGVAYDHITEVQEAQQGLVKRIQAIQKQLADTRIDDATRASLQTELSQASKLLDYSKKFLPMP